MTVVINGSTGISPVTATGTSALVDGMTVGRGAGEVATNTAVGASALAANTSGASNTAIGNSSLISNTTASYNTAVGFESARAVTTGQAHTALGNRALYSTTTPDYNVGIGYFAGYSTTTGGNNTAIGSLALYSNTTASNNTAVGYQAGYTNSTGTYLTTLGWKAGYSSTGDYNTFLGAYSGQASTGVNNTFVGQGSGDSMTTGGKNTILGRYNGNSGGLDIRTASNYIVLSDGDGNPRGQFSSGGAWTWQAVTGGNTYGIIWDGAEIYPSIDNTVKLGFPSQRWSTVYAGTGTINTSDANLKQDIAALDDAEKRVAIAIKSLIKKYRFKDAVAEKGDEARIHIGAIAQEVAAAFVAEGLDSARYALFCSDTWYEVEGKTAQDLTTPYTAETPNAVEVTRLGLRYEELLAFVIAAM